MTAPIILDPAHDVLHMQGHPLDVFFTPRSVAVIGATEAPGSVGRTLLQNLLASPFGGPVFPVNPKRASVLGVKSYPDIGSVPDRVDLAVIVTPAPTVPGVINACVAAGVKGAIVISAGFKETGPEGATLERQVLEEARRGGIRLVGPNCLGVMSPLAGLNATFAQSMAIPGSVAFLSQSGALLTAVLDYSLRERIGFSAFVSLGSMLDIGWGDLIDYLGSDSHTQSIVLYMESVGDARKFLSAARQVALTKPILVIKAGRTPAAAQAAASHTGALTGSDEVLDAAFHRSGVLRVDSIGDLFSVAEALAKQPLPQGPRLTILTNAGGPGVLATDALILGGGELSVVSQDTLAEFNTFLPSAWSHGNPIDVLGDAGPERYAKTLETAASDPQSNGLLVILTPQAMTDSTRTAEDLRPYARVGKPVLASWMGGDTVAAGRSLLSAAGIPAFPYPDDAARVFNAMWRYSAALKNLYETPTLTADEDGTNDPKEVRRLIEAVRAEGRTLLTEPESKQVLAAAGIPTVPTVIAHSVEGAVAAADGMRYPVVLKIYSQTITHKTDVGGVQLNLKDAGAVAGAYRLIEDSVREKVGAEHFGGVTVQPMIPPGGYEVILGSSLDPQFGPVLLFGTGGQLVEVYKDRALALPPLTTTLARRMMEGTRIYTALKGVRGRPQVDLAALEQILVRFAELAATQPAIKEMDINPLLASPERLLALDARIVLHDLDVDLSQVPRAAIRPYPAQYVQTVMLRDGEAAALRPIRPDDEPLLARFHETLSERSVAQRYIQPLNLSQRTAHDRLVRICHSDYDRDLLLVVDRRDAQLARHQIIAIGRLTRTHHPGEAKLALLVSDPFQDQGLGTRILEHLLVIAHSEGITRIIAPMRADNTAMRSLCTQHDFREVGNEDGVLTLVWADGS